MQIIWKNRILDKFRNTRKRKDNAYPEVLAKKKGKREKLPSIKRAEVVPQWGMPNYSPTRPPSEDDISVAKHEEILKKEKSKRQPDFSQVRLAMDKTFADRRKWLLTTQPTAKMSEVKEKYPWLFDEDQVI